MSHSTRHPSRLGPLPSRRARAACKTLAAGAATIAALAGSGFAQAGPLSLDPNLVSVVGALQAAPVLSYAFGTDTAWSADAGSFAGGCSGSNGNPSQASASGDCTGSMGSTASASADLTSGTLSASAMTPAVTANGSAAGALMWTTLVFSGASPGQTGTFELPLTGSFANGGFGVAGIAVNPSSSWITNWTQVNASNSSPTLSVPFSLANGVPTEFAAGLGVDTQWNGNQATASLDPPWTVMLPTGVTYSPVDGAPTILGSPGGGSSVPEPGALSLMLMGLALFAWAALRRRGRDIKRRFEPSSTVLGG